MCIRIRVYVSIAMCRGGRLYVNLVLQISNFRIYCRNVLNLVFQYFLIESWDFAGIFQLLNPQNQIFTQKMPELTEIILLTVQFLFSKGRVHSFIHALIHTRCTHISTRLRISFEVCKKTEPLTVHSKIQCFISFAARKTVYNIRHNDFYVCDTR